MDPVFAPKRKRGRPRKGEELGLTEEQKVERRRVLFRASCLPEQEKLELLGKLQSRLDQRMREIEILRIRFEQKRQEIENYQKRILEIETEMKTGCVK